MTLFSSHSYTQISGRKKWIVRSISILLFLCTTQFVVGQSLFVSAVLDGERLVLSSGEKIELIGVDVVDKFSGTEHMNDILRLGGNTETVRSKASITAAYVSMLVRSRHVQVSYQVAEEKMVQEKHSNSFIPAFLFVLDENGRSDFILNKKLLEDGYAYADPATPEAYIDQFIALQQQAMTNRRGLWAMIDQTTGGNTTGIVNPSGRADVSSGCRWEKRCVWITGADQNTGYWATKNGQVCPCAN